MASATFGSGWHLRVEPPAGRPHPRSAVPIGQDSGAFVVVQVDRTGEGRLALFPLQ